MAQRMVVIETEDGACPASLSNPDGKGPWPGVLLFSDGGGMRGTFREMGERLSDLGYVVLVPDVYYRHGPYKAVDMSTRASIDQSMGRLSSWISGYTTDQILRDVTSFIDSLDSVPEKAPGGVGTTGYCLGGRISILAAANLGERVSAAASFHGGNIANPDDPESPHRKAKDIKASLYVAGAMDDSYFTDEERELLDRSLSDAGVDFTLETYHAHHGFAVPDNVNFDAAAADRHWQAAEQFFRSVLG